MTLLPGFACDVASALSIVASALVPSAVVEVEAAAALATATEEGRPGDVVDA